MKVRANVVAIEEEAIGVELRIRINSSPSDIQALFTSFTSRKEAFAEWQKTKQAILSKLRLGDVDLTLTYYDLKKT